MKIHNVDKCVIAGGVAANKGIRNKLNQLSKENNFKTIYPDIKLCGDNAAMIAMAGLERFKNNRPEWLKRFPGDQNLISYLLKENSDGRVSVS